jgi:hypothetical protein
VSVCLAQAAAHTATTGFLIYDAGLVKIEVACPFAACVFQQQMRCEAAESRIQRVYVNRQRVKKTGREEQHDNIHKTEVIQEVTEKEIQVSEIVRGKII